MTFVVTVPTTVMISYQVEAKDEHEALQLKEYKIIKEVITDIANEDVSVMTLDEWKLLEEVGKDE